MKCKKFINDISADLDGQLSQSQKATLLIHLNSCADCRLKLNELKMVKSALSDLCARPIPTELARKLSALARGGSLNHLRRKRRGFSFAEATFAVVALAALLIFSVIAYKKSTPVDSNPWHLEVPAENGSMRSKAPIGDETTFLSEPMKRITFKEEILTDILSDLQLEVRPEALGKDLSFNTEYAGQIELFKDETAVSKAVLFKGEEALLIAVFNLKEGSPKRVYIFNEETKRIIYQREL